MLGFSRPVPSTMTQSPSMNSALLPASPRITWPSVINTPPQNTAVCAPSKRSATQPPGMATMYTAAVYRP